MLISALCEYAQKQVDSGIPDGWQEQGIHYRILLTPEGDICDIVDVRKEIEVPAKGGKIKKVPRPQAIILPFRTQKTAIDSNIIEHRPFYIFGLDYESKAGCFTSDSTKARKSHEAFVQHETEFFDGLDSEICLAYRRFLEKWIPAEMKAHPALLNIGKEYKGAYFGFALGLERGNLEEDIQFCKRYSEYLQRQAAEKEERGAEQSVCAILGQQLPVARIHDKISGFPGGQSSGCVLVGMKESAYESYSKTQSYNSNISEEAMKLYTGALNRLLSDRTHYKILGDMTVLYFAMKTNDSKECAWFSELFSDSSNLASQEEHELDALMQEVRQGRLNALPERGIDADVTFYIVGLTPNATRISQKFIVRDKFSAIIGNLAKHQQDLCIGDNTHQIRFSQIEKQLISPKSTDAKVPPPLMTAIMLAALNGTRYPDALLSTIIRRIKTDSDEENNSFIRLNNIRAGIIKACLNRKAKKEEIKLAWDETSQNPAYLCGALFAVYEKIQQDSAGTGLNRTIKDAYFASACSRPASIMPKLDRLSANHQRKLSEGSKIFYQQLIGKLISGLNGSFPSTLSLDNQGRFIIGYYHMNRKLWTGNEKQEDKENV